MSIRKVKGLEEKFFILPNATINDDLSWGAKGMLAYLCAKPSDWRVSVQELINHSARSAKPTKRDGTYAIINELMDKGYLQRERTAGNGYSKTDYIVSPEPLPDNPDTVEPDTVEPTLQSTEIKQSTELNKTNGSSTDKPKSKYSDDFEQAWKEYPKREGSNPKNKAYSAWKARLKEGVMLSSLCEGMRRYRAYCEQKGQLHTSYVMQASRFWGPEENYKCEWSISSIQPYKPAHPPAIDMNSRKWVVGIEDMI